jgi:hypothetical protein
MQNDTDGMTKEQVSDTVTSTENYSVTKTPVNVLSGNYKEFQGCPFNFDMIVKPHFIDPDYKWGVDFYTHSTDTDSYFFHPGLAIILSPDGSPTQVNCALSFTQDEGNWSHWKVDFDTGYSF